MKFICQTCGKESGGDVPFCPHCGGNITECSAPTPRKHKVFEKINLVLLIAIILVVVSSLGLLIWQLSKDPYETAVKTYMDIFFAGEYEKIEKLVPEDVWKQKEKDLGLSREQLLEQFKCQDSLTAITMAFTQKYGDNATVSYLIDEKNKYDDEKLGKLAEKYENSFGIKADRINAAYDLTLEFYVKDDKEHEHLTASVTVVQIDRKWYIPEPEFITEVK